MIRRARRLAVATSAGAVLLAIALARPASAHAVLLHTDPAAQSTSSVAPATVRLQFSEAVESAFGSVRVVDNDGHDVTSGGVIRRSGGRELDVAVHPRQGTTFVSFQVVSSDGHVERGGFSFYVGSPSTTPPHSVGSGTGAPALTGWAYGALRAGWFVALFCLIGLAVVRGLVWPGAVFGAGDLDESVTAALERRAGWLALASAGLGVVCAVGVLLAQAASDAGRGLLWAAHGSSVREVLRTTAGRYALATVVVSAVAVVPAAALWQRARRGRSPGPWLAGLFVAASAAAVAEALGGHARTLGHPVIGVPALSLHLIAIGTWVGGVAALIVLGGRAWRALPIGPRAVLARSLVIRFGQVAAVAVAAVLVTGIVSAVLDLGRARDLIGLPYGRMLLVKIVLVQAALLLGARHRWFSPATFRHDADATRVFERSALTELGVLTLAVFAGAGLMVMVPGRSLVQSASGELDLRTHAGPYSVELSVTPNTPGDSRVYVLFLSADGHPARAVTGATAVLSVRNGAGADLPLSWLSDGRFAADVSFPSAGTYQLQVGDGHGVRAGFEFAVRGAAPASLPPA